MKKIHLLLPALLALLAVSCTDDFIERGPSYNNDDEEGLITKEYQVEFESRTRATLFDNTPVWEVGESLSVYDPVASKARTFTVTKVEDNKATISGEISEGDFAFSAVYPAACAGTWSSISECAITIPAAQTIPSGREIDPGVLVSQAYTETPSQGIIFHNKVSLLSFSIEREDISRITLDLSGASDKSYTITSATGTVPTGKTLYIAVDAGEYASGIKASCTNDYDISYVKSSTKKLSAEVNGILSLGVISDGVKKVGYEITKQGTMAGLDAYISDFGLGDNDLVKLALQMGKTIISEVLPYKDETATYVCYTFKSIDPFGKPATLSSYVIFLNKAVGGSRAALGTVIANHATIDKNSECPTNKTCYEAALCFKNYAVVIPDYYGLGASVAHHHPLFNINITPRNTFDAYDAALQIMSDMGVSVGSQVYNVGYSQGAYNALANVKYLSGHPERGVTLTKTFAGGSPSDLETTYNTYLDGGWDGATIYTLSSMAAFREYDATGVSYSDLYKEPLLSNYQDWLFTNNYSISEIETKIGSDKLSEILTSQFLSKSGTAYETIMAVGRKHSLVEGDWSPVEGSKIYIYHSQSDDVVPYANHTAIQNYLSSRSSGSTVVFKDLSTSLINSSDKALYAIVSKIIINTGNTIEPITHDKGAAFFAYDVIRNNW